MGKRTVIAALTFAIAAMAPDQTALPWQTQAVTNSQTPENTLIAVFTGDKGRIPEGLRLLSEKAGNHLLISGYDLPICYECRAAASEGQEVLLDTKAKNTRENAINTARIAREGNYSHIILVTSDYHMERSFYLLRNRLRDTRITIHPYPVVSETNLRPAIESERWKMWVTRRGIETSLRHYLR
ncbi:MAG: YdcF family protein [Alphaproteobacteria bacterium]|nr:YdcF family protein [Alphaproteobacteria bacterium]